MTDPSVVLDAEVDPDADDGSAGDPAAGASVNEAEPTSSPVADRA